jgi:hypothetical protein
MQALRCNCFAWIARDRCKRTCCEDVAVRSIVMLEVDVTLDMRDVDIKFGGEQGSHICCQVDNLAVCACSCSAVFVLH